MMLPLDLGSWQGVLSALGLVAVGVWTTPRTWVTSELVTSSLGNTHWRDNFAALRASPPNRCHVYNSATQNLTADGGLTFNSEDTDPSGMHSTSADTSRVTIPSGGGGFYIVHARLLAANPGTGSATHSIRKSGTTKLIEDVTNTTTNSPHQLTWMGELAAGDYLELYIDKSDGSTWTFGSATATQADRLMVVGPLPYA